MFLFDVVNSCNVYVTRALVLPRGTLDYAREKPLRNSDIVNYLNSLAVELAECEPLTAF